MARSTVRGAVLVVLSLVAVPLLGAAEPAKAAAPGADPRWIAARVDGGRVGVMIELTGEPTARTYARALGGVPAIRALAANVAGQAGITAQANLVAQRQLAGVEAAQQAILPALSSQAIGAQVIYRLQRVYNGIAAYVDPTKVDAIRRLPGVKDVQPLVPYDLLLTYSVPFIGAPQVWQGSGVTGTNISIGIIDTGIDYLHKDFGGSGVYRTDNIYTSASWPKNAKVAGGYDFAGDNYNGNNTPAPDPDPMDLASSSASSGHGTHVAGIAAGYGVDSDGITYAGPWDTTIDPTTLTIGPGVAPGAKLYAIRVFGNAGRSGIIPQGIEWAIDPNKDGNFSDHLDVINLSVGSLFGAPTDSLQIAAENAAAAGVIVVAASGNDGDTSFITSSPGTGSHVISVAATGDRGSRFAGLQITAPAEIAATLSTTAALFGGFTPETGLPGSVAVAAPADACSAITNGSAIAGKFALIDRGTCTFVVKVKAAQNAGAAGVIVADNKSEALISMAGDDPSITIPAVFITQADGTTLKGKLPSPGVQATMILVTYAGTVQDFSARGPRLTQDGLKPDIAAPGLFIASASSRSGTGASQLAGTSMASPHVAGAMALLKQLHSTWTPQALKALLMETGVDTTVNVNQQPPIASPVRVGGGLVNLPSAAAASSVAYDADAPDLVSLFFGALDVSTATSVTRTVKVDNLGASDQTFALGYAGVTSVPGVGISFPNGASLTVPADGSTTFPVRLTADPSAMKHTADPGITASQDSRPRQWLAEEAGYVTLTPPTGTRLRVPLYAEARPVAAIATAETNLIMGAADGTLTVNLAGHGLETGTSYPVDIVSLVTPLELQFTGPDTAPANSRNASIRYVGVASDYAGAGGGSLTATTLEFGIVTVADWATPNQVTFSVQIDTNRDGTPDYTLETIDSATFADSTASNSDVFGVKLCPKTGSCTWEGYVNRFSASELDTEPFNTNVMLLPVRAADIGLSAASSAFDYHVSSSNSDVSDISFTAKATFDPAKPGLGPLSGMFGPVPARAGGLLQFAYNRANYAANGSQGLLLIHHHNAAGNRAQVLPVTATDCALTCSASVPAEVVAGSEAGLSASATTTGCSPTIAYDWAFGDGTANGSGATTQHRYANAGSYSWTLTASASGMTCTQSGSVTAVAAGTTRPPRKRTIHAVR